MQPIRHSRGGNSDAWRPLYHRLLNRVLPVPVASLSKAWVWGRWPAEIVGSNPIGASLLFYVLIGPCDELITRIEEFYGMWYVVVCDLETS